MPKLRKGKFKGRTTKYTTVEVTPVEMIGTKAWDLVIPKPIQPYMAGALHAMENGDVGPAVIALGHAWDEAVKLEIAPKPIVYFAAEGAKKGYFTLRGKQPNNPNLPAYRQMALDFASALCEMDQTDAVARHGLATFYDELGELEEAIRHYRHITLMDSDQVETWGNLGAALYSTGDVAGAWKAWERCTARPPRKASEAIAQSYIYLRRGQYVDGFQRFNQRWDYPNFRDEYGRKDLGGIHWRGEKLPKNAALFLHGEQGGGDHVQFARYVPLLAEQGVTVVGLECRDVLKRWLSSSTDIPIFARGVDALPEFTHHCSTLDLPGILGTTLETVPPPLAPPPGYGFKRFGVIEAGSRKINTNMRVGIAWEGAKGNTADWMRSVPPSELRHLADIPGVTWVSLQFADDAAMTGRAWLGKSFVDGTEGCTDALDTAAVMRGLDLVVTVDTMTAHLAGSLGVPTWCLHRFHREWRHGDESVTGEANPWYPSMVNLTQQQPGNWTELLLRVRERLINQAR